MSQAPHHSFDIIIAGGGAGGLALALTLLQRCDISIAIIETNPQGNAPSKESSTMDVRSVALSAFSCEFLQRLGIENLSELAQPIEKIRVTDQGHIGQTMIDSLSLQRDYLGQVIELNELNNALLEQLKPHQGESLTWFCPDKVAAITKQKDCVDISLESGGKLHTKLLVIAEGGMSATRELAGIQSSTKDYPQSAIVANVRLDRDHHNCAHERFTPTGPLALLPIRSVASQPAHSYCSLVWTVDRQDADKILAYDDPRFLSALQQQFGYRLGRLQQVGNRQSFPLSLQQAHSHISQRVALISNAAQMLHPIAGQGLNLGIRDIATLSHLLLSNNDPGHPSLLYQYQRLRQPDQQLTIGATDTLVSLFSNQYLPLVVGRNLGLLGLQCSARLKQYFAMTAMGYNDTRQIDAKL